MLIPFVSPLVEDPTAEEGSGGERHWRERRGDEGRWAVGARGDREDEAWRRVVRVQGDLGFGRGPIGARAMGRFGISWMSIGGRFGGIRTRYANFLCI